MNEHSIPRSVAGAATIAADAIDVEVACDYILQHAKPAAHWRVGLEYELIGFERETSRRMDRAGVQNLLRALIRRGGAPTLEDTNIISLRMSYGDVTLEPGGQMEFSGFPERELADAETALRRFIADLHECSQERDIYFVGLGFDPLCKLEEQAWIRKQRYDIMRPYLRTRGGHAWDMMTRTASMQISVDYGDEANLGRKYVLGNRLGPIIAAMFANSPYADGSSTGLKSTRYAVWLDTDPDRSGPGPATFDDCFDLHACVSALLDVPVFFIKRNGALRDRVGLRLADIPEARPDDFRDLLSMIFTEARIREYVEMRSADGGDPEMALALGALWKGLTYDAETLDAALEAAPRLSPAAYRALQMAVARDALAARCENVDVLAVAREVVALAIVGLCKIAPDEVHYLDPLSQNVIEDGVAPADVLLRNSEGDVKRAMRMTTIA